MAGFPRDENNRQLGDKAKQPRPGIPLDKKEIERLLRHYHGNISRTADKLGTTRTGVRNVINSDPHLQQVLHETRERFIDELEETAWHKALQGDTVLNLFLLKTIGKERGYEQDSNKDRGHAIATAAFDYIMNRTKNPASS